MSLKIVIEKPLRKFEENAIFPQKLPFSRAIFEKKINICTKAITGFWNSTMKERENF